MWGRILDCEESEARVNLLMADLEEMGWGNDRRREGIYVGG